MEEIGKSKHFETFWPSVSNQKQNFRHLKENARCGICLEPTLIQAVAQGDLMILQCHHHFHFDCWRRWNNSGNLLANCCPFCREDPFDLTIVDGLSYIQANVFVGDGSILVFLPQ